MPPLVLRPLTVADEEAFTAAHREMVESDGFEFGLQFRPGEDFGAFVDRHARFARGEGLPDGLVPATFLVADVGGTIVVRASIRHELNEFLAHEGGHIGYGVLPAHRRRGHATEILRQSLVVARAAGVGRVLVTCDDDNIGSATVIERNGGVLAGVVTDTRDGVPKRRYWID